MYSFPSELHDGPVLKLSMATMATNRNPEFCGGLAILSVLASLRGRKIALVTPSLLLISILSSEKLALNSPKMEPVEQKELKYLYHTSCHIIIDANHLNICDLDEPFCKPDNDQG